MQRAEETAMNDDPAVHTAAQNASIEEYKNSVDPGLAEYVDRVRAGEKLEPYVVAETGDRMRSAMMELTGLEKVGDRTLMDSNAVQHITNRHAGGDGSADGTMKESADVARAAYVLNNFDNAYLSKNKADGYFNSKGKRASIIIFEKKIDGSHVVVEAVCDTKKNTNYIVTEYLSKNGVDEKEVAKGLRSPMSAASDPGVYVRNVVVDPSATAEELQSSMDAASDPRDTPETLADLPSAKTNIAPEGGVVNGRSYAEETLTADESALDSSGWASGEQKAAAAQLARAGRVSTQGVQTIVDNMPGGIGAGVYTQAAKAMYRAGVYNVESFEKALNATGPEGSRGYLPCFTLPETLYIDKDGFPTVNQPPEITSDAGESGVALGKKNEPFTLPYTVTDGDGDPMTITEKVNGVALAVRENVATGTELTAQCLSEKVLFQQILNGENTLVLEAGDGKTTTEWTATFTKNVTSAVLSLAQPLTADDTITVAALTLEGSFPADISLTVELTNNARDDAPVWENCTDIQRGESRAFAHHAFANKTAAKGAAFNYKVTITRGASGVGGNITMIGGVIG